MKLSDFIKRKEEELLSEYRKVELVEGGLKCLIQKN